MNDKLKLIREKCIAANPEIMELKFGCEIECKLGEWNKYKVLVGIGVCEKGHKNLQTCERNDCYMESGIWAFYDSEENMHTINLKDGEYEILGRPIRLADILLAMNTNLKISKVAMEGWLEIITGEKWNLRADDLEKQSPETIDFLANLLQ